MCLDYKNDVIFRFLNTFFVVWGKSIISSNSTQLQTELGMMPCGEKAVWVDMVYRILWPLFVSSGTLSGQTSHREVSKPRDSCLYYSNRSDIWQVPRQQRCRGAVKFPSVTIIITPNIAASRLDFTRFVDKISYRLVNKSPGPLFTKR